MMIKKNLIILGALIFFVPLFAQNIHEAAQNGDLVAVTEILTRNPGAASIKDGNGKTALHFAAQANRLNIARLLLEKGSSPNAANVNGATPIHYAAFFGFLDMVDLLVSNGGKLDAADKMGNTPLSRAVERGHMELAGYLLGKGVSLNPQSDLAVNMLHRAAAGGQEEFLGQIIKRGVPLAALNQSGGNLLHSSARGGIRDLAFLPGKDKSWIDKRDYYGLTPLDYALSHGHKETAKLLISLGAKKGQKKNRELTGDYLGQAPPGLKAQLFAPGIISTASGNERDISFSPRGEQFYFSRDAKIYEINRVEGTWTGAQKAPFSGSHQDFEACFAPGGKRLYFISNRPHDRKDSEQPWNIWYVERQAGTWGKPNLLGGPFAGFFYPTFTRQGTMYLTGPQNNIHRALWEKGAYRSSTNLGPPVNTPQAQYNALIAPDESYLVFTSFGHGPGLGNGDLWISFRGEKGDWAAPVNMGPEVNSPGHDYCPNLSPDGKYLFFAGNRFGNDDIFWIHAGIIEKLKKKVKK